MGSVIVGWGVTFVSLTLERGYGSATLVKNISKIFYFLHLFNVVVVVDLVGVLDLVCAAAGAGFSKGCLFHYAVPCLRVSLLCVCVIFIRARRCFSVSVFLKFR